MSVPSKTLEGIVDKVVDFVALEGAGLVSVVLVENGVDGLSELIVTGFTTHDLIIC